MGLTVVDRGVVRREIVICESIVRINVVQVQMEKCRSLGRVRRGSGQEEN